VLWPYHSGHPLAFAAQFDLSDLAPFDERGLLPPEGILLFFVMDPYYETIARYEDTIFRVLYYGKSAEPLRRCTCPHQLSAEGRFAPCKLTFSRQITLQSYQTDDPLTERLYGFPATLRSDELHAYFALEKRLLAEAGGVPHTLHRLLGHPDLLQYGMRGDLAQDLEDTAFSIDAGRDESSGESPNPFRTRRAFPWHLLLQLDSDGQAGMRWSGAGRIFFWIRDRDLRGRDFSRVVLLDQAT
jgi:uncharacterized protein YwqG